jgi:ABC-type glycerol-3-phosphate transport system substrate-binding protein
MIERAAGKRLPSMGRGGWAVRSRAVSLAVMLMMAPLGTRAADLVVWWEKGSSAQEDEAVREIIAAFEQDSGKQVELEQPSQSDIEAKALAAVV